MILMVHQPRRWPATIPWTLASIPQTLATTPHLQSSQPLSSMFHSPSVTKSHHCLPAIVLPLSEEMPEVHHQPCPCPTLAIFSFSATTYSHSLCRLHPLLITDVFPITGRAICHQFVRHHPPSPAGEALAATVAVLSTLKMPTSPPYSNHHAFQLTPKPPSPKPLGCHLQLPIATVQSSSLSIVDWEKPTIELESQKESRIQ